jgi:hypothetical protein
LATAFGCETERVAAIVGASEPVSAAVASAPSDAGAVPQAWSELAQTAKKADLQLSLAERVSRLAGRLSRNEVGAHATLLDGATPVADIDLSRHGSIVQALSESKR